MSEQIKLFNMAVATILSHLYSVHPQPVNGEDLTGLSKTISDVYERMCSDEFDGEKYFEFHAVLDDTLVWLGKEKFVSFEAMQGHRRPVNVQLTLNGFAAVQRITKLHWWQRPKPFDEYVKNLFNKNDTQGVLDVVSLVLKVFSG